jgi:glyceraldehyde-3-phosphate dehydrogenase (NADP+)
MQTADYNSLLSVSEEKFPKQLVCDEYLCGGEVKKWTGKLETVYSPIYSTSGNKVVLGQYPMLNEETSLAVLKNSVEAYNYGQGEWPTMSAKNRIKCVQKFVAMLKTKRDQIIDLLIWEICKNKEDSTKEFDRTIKYIEDTIEELKKMENMESTFIHAEGIVAQIRRAPFGVVVCVGPFNYPFNETYTTLIPSIIMGNCVIMKLPRTGVLCHAPTYELFRSCFPPGVVNIISGSGRETLPPIMKTGHVDVFAFIGTSQASDSILKAHPNPHRLRTVLGLEAKNPACVFADADLKNAVEQCVLGSLSYNGQRCTAIKMILVHESIVDKFVPLFSEAVDALVMGLPFTQGVKITPLPEPGKPGFIQELIDDAIEKGAKIVNPRGGKMDRTLLAPTVLYPVNENMRIFSEEQFGPLVPIMTFKGPEDVYQFFRKSHYGQQVSIFSTKSETIGHMITILTNQVTRVNVNVQCQRGPDSFPFTGRRDSAQGTLSIHDALRVFSIRSTVATKDIEANTTLLSDIVQNKDSTFLRMDHIF